MKDIRYVQLEPAAFLTDVDFQLMDAEQRGVYCSIIFYLYANGGKLELDNSEITLLSDGSNKLAAISGCYKTGPAWKQLWGIIAPKFQINGNILTHKRVTEELERAKSLKEAKSKGGKKGMETRWADKTLITKESKGKVSKEKEIIYIYTKQEFINAGFQSGLSEQEAIECYEHYKGQNFEFKKDFPIRNPADACNRWRNNRHRFENRKQINEKTPDNKSGNSRDGEYIR